MTLPPMARPLHPRPGLAQRQRLHGRPARARVRRLLHHTRELHAGLAGRRPAGQHLPSGPARGCLRALSGSHCKSSFAAFFYGPAWVLNGHFRRFSGPGSGLAAVGRGAARDQPLGRAAARPQRLGCAAQNSHGGGGRKSWAKLNLDSDRGSQPKRWAKSRDSGQQNILHVDLI